MLDSRSKPAQDPRCDEPGWCHANAEGVMLELYVQPNAKLTEAVGEHDGALKIRLHAPPIDGRANEALLAWLAARLGLARKQIILKSGQSSRRKRVQLVALGLDAAELARKLSA
jgi:uncharacterized protein (TIGR00251 family)